MFGLLYGDLQSYCCLDVIPDYIDRSDNRPLCSRQSRHAIWSGSAAMETACLRSKIPAQFSRRSDLDPARKLNLRVLADSCLFACCSFTSIGDDNG